MTFRADDRVLLLHIPPPPQVAALARVLMRGLIVGLGPRESVDQARAALADFDNVMFIEGDYAHIPWRDAFFTKIITPPGLGPIADLHRLLAPGGEIVSETENA